MIRIGSTKGLKNTVEVRFTTGVEQVHPLEERRKVKAQRMSWIIKEMQIVVVAAETGEMIEVVEKMMIAVETRGMIEESIRRGVKEMMSVDTGGGMREEAIAIQRGVLTVERRGMMIETIIRREVLIAGGMIIEVTDWKGQMMG